MCRKHGISAVGERGNATYFRSAIVDDSDSGLSGGLDFLGSDKSRDANLSWWAMRS
jgi:hypothetical protein